MAAAGLSACAKPAPDVPVASSAGVVLAGELHDNADAHERRTAWLKERLDAGARPALAMEQFDRERQGDLDRALRECRDAACVVRKAGGAQSGWTWAYYEPLIALALEHKLPIVAANLSRADAMKAARQGPSAVFDVATMQALKLDREPPPDLVSGQRKAIVDGHCGKLPAAAVDGIVRAQFARDAWMAKVVEDHAARGVVLLAGNGHVRRDLGVPRWLDPALATRAYSIGFVEDARDGEFDFVVVVPAAKRGDPCAGLR